MLRMPVQRVESGLKLGVSSAAPETWFSLALRRKVLVAASQPAPRGADTHP